MAILRLEQELGRQLFIRDKQGVILTPAAEYLLPIARQVVELTDKCEAYFTTGATHQKVLPIACAPGSIEEFAGELVREFQDEHPETHLQILECTDADCEHAVTAGEVELGFSCGECTSRLLEAHTLAVSRYALIVHKDHPLAGQDKVGIQALKGLPLVIMKETTKTYCVIRDACQRAGFEPVVDTFVHNILTVFDLPQIRQGVGVASCALASRLNRPLLRTIPIDEESCDWNVDLIKQVGSTLSPVAKLFEKKVLERLDRQGVIRRPS